MSARSFTGVLAVIAEAAGPAAALKLARELGGTELKLSGRRGGKLARIVGLNEARAIVEALGHTKIMVPMAGLRGARGRREAAARMLRAGASASRAALACDVHERTIWRIKARSPSPAPLFDEDEDERA